MPIYEYECPKCGEFEITQRITEDPLKKCPTCKSKVRKLISNTSFQLKGSGWYVTDYGGKKGAAKESGTGESGGKDSTASSDSSSSSTKDTSSKSDSSTTKSEPATKKSESSTKSKDPSAKAA
jgi:putative FmdB family regulatory protein